METIPQLLAITDPYSVMAQQMFEIYQYSFPVEEQEPVAYLQREIEASALKNNQGEGGLYVLGGIVEGELKVFCIFHYSIQYRLGFISFIAVKQDAKGKGYGSWMFQEVLEYLRKQPNKSLRGVCWEVDIPDEAGTVTEKVIRNKRIRFYEKNGSKVLSHIGYTAPPITEKLPPVTYYLMYKSFEKAPDSLSFQWQKNMLEFIFFEIYEVDENNAFYKKTLATIL